MSWQQRPAVQRRGAPLPTDSGFRPEAELPEPPLEAGAGRPPGKMFLKRPVSRTPGNALQRETLNRRHQGLNAGSKRYSRNQWLSQYNTFGKCSVAPFFAGLN